MLKIQPILLFSGIAVLSAGRLYAEDLTYRSVPLALSFQYNSEFSPTRTRDKNIELISIRLTSEGDLFSVTEQPIKASIQPDAIQLSIPHLKKTLKATSLVLKERQPISGQPSWHYAGVAHGRPIDFWVVYRPKRLTQFICVYAPTSSRVDVTPACEGVLHSVRFLDPARMQTSPDPVISVRPNPYLRDGGQPLTLESLPLLPSLGTPDSNWEIEFSTFVKRVMIQDGIQTEKVEIQISDQACGERPIACVKPIQGTHRLALIYNRTKAAETLASKDGRAFTWYCVFHEIKHIRFWEPDKQRLLTLLKTSLDRQVKRLGGRTTFDVQMMDASVFTTPSDFSLTAKQKAAVQRLKEDILHPLTQANIAIDEIEADAYAIMEWRRLFGDDIPFDVKWSARTYLKTNLTRLQEATEDLRDIAPFVAEIVDAEANRTVNAILEELRAKDAAPAS